MLSIIPLGTTAHETRYLLNMLPVQWSPLAVSVWSKVKKIEVGMSSTQVPFEVKPDKE